MTFKGWPDAALDFYVGLEADNSKAYWPAHKPTYDECVKAPFLELSELIEQEFGPLHVFRPNRDTRFSKDKTPYKTAAAAVTESQGGAAYYVQISAEGLYAGQRLLPPRSPISSSGSAPRSPTTGPGPKLATAVDALRKQKYDVDARDSLKRLPARLRPRPPAGRAVEA